MLSEYEVTKWAVAASSVARLFKCWRIAATSTREFASLVKTLNNQPTVSSESFSSAEASVCGEIRSHRQFYDYEAKYHDDSTELIIPADLEPAESEQLRAMAIAAFRALDGEGMARVDFLFDRNTRRAYVNELNSLPGFTSVSMYPKLWEASGLPYPQLLDRLIELALERHDRRSKLETHAPPPLSGGSAVGSPKQA